MSHVDVLRSDIANVRRFVRRVEAVGARRGDPAAVAHNGWMVRPHQVVEALDKAVASVSSRLSCLPQRAGS